MSAKKQRAPSIVEEVIPEDLIKPIQSLHQNYCDNHTCGEFEEQLLKVLDEIVLGDKNEKYFVTLLKALGLSASTDDNDPTGLAIANVLWLRGTQVNATTDPTYWSKLCTVTKEVANSGLVTLNLLKTTLEFSLLIDSKVLKEEVGALQKKMIRVNTGLVYKQQKYNLFREETEGYSKIVTTLTNSLPQYPQDCSACVANVLSIIGQFDLDPNRVLDVILDVFEQSPLNLSFVTLLKHFKHSNIVHMLGYKFNYYLGKYLEETGVAAPVASVDSAASGDKKTSSTVSAGKTVETSSSSGGGAATTGGLKKSDSKMQVSAGGPSAATAGAASAVGSASAAGDDKSTDLPMPRPTAAPASLYALAASLIMNDLVAIDELAAYLQPSLDVTKTLTEALEKELQKTVKSYGVVNLNASASAAAAASAASNATSGAVRVRDIGAAVQSNDVTKDVVRPPSLALKAATAAAEKAAKSGDVKETPLLLGSPEYDDVLKLFQELDCLKSSCPYAQGNQLVGLATALIRLRGWQQARYILNLLEEQGAVEVVRYSHDLRKALIDLTLYVVDAVYHQVSVQQRHLAVSSSFAAAVSHRNKNNKKAASASLTDLPSFPQVQLKQITSLNEFPSEVTPLLSYLGYHVSENPTLYARLCRLSQAYLNLKCPFTAGASDDGTVSAEPIITILTSTLLPALTVCTDPNPFLASQVWLVVSQLPFQIRFEIYDAWKGSGTGKEALLNKPTSIALAETKTLHTARSDLKRLAKENVKSVGLKLSKVTHCCPIVVYSHVLSTIEVFDNLIQYVVDALKFSTELARDCMAYCLIAQLKREHGGKLKKGDTHYSSWFSALSRFIANYYCKYSSTELKGLLHYLLQVLSNGESLDLLVLKELLCVMGSCDTLLEVSQVQLEGLSGGRSLRSEVMGTGNRSATITANAAKKAMTALRDELISSNTALPLLLFIAQIRCKILFDASSTQLKLISHLFDIAQDVLMQFTDFLVAAGAKTLQHIAVLMPPLNTMLDEIGLVIPVAFQLVRPIVRAALQFGEENNAEGAAMPDYLKPWHPFSESMLSIIKPAVEEGVWKHITPSLYVLFWSLSYYDIDTPTGRYQMEMKRIKDKHSDLENRKYTISMTNPATTLNYTTSEVNKLNKTRESDMTKLLATIATLNEEMDKQQKHVTLISNLIANQKEGFCVNPAGLIEAFSNTVTEEVEGAVPAVPPTETDLIMATTEVILQELVFHRVLMSPIDAIYCVKFLLLLHQQETPHFSFLYCVDQMITSLTPLIFSTTEVEASFIGYALSELLSIVNKWVANKALYQVECQNKLGSTYPVDHWLPPAMLEKLKESARLAAAAAESEGIVEERHTVTHEMFLELAKGWHTKLFTIIIASLNGKEYMYVRSSLILMSKITSQFPTRAVEGRKIIVRVEVLQDEEKNREDLQLMAKSLSTMLKRTVWIDEKPAKKRVKTVAPIIFEEEKQQQPQAKTGSGATAGTTAAPETTTVVGRSNTTGSSLRDDRSGAVRDRLRDSRSTTTGGRDSGRDGNNTSANNRDSNLNSTRDSRSSNNLSGSGNNTNTASSSAMTSSRDNKSSRDLRDSLSLPPLAPSGSDSRRGDNKDSNNRDSKSSGAVGGGSNNDSQLSGQKRKANEAEVKDGNKDSKDRKSRSNSRGRNPVTGGNSNTSGGNGSNAASSSAVSGSSGVKRSHEAMSNDQRNSTNNNNNDNSRRDNRDTGGRPSSSGGAHSNSNNDRSRGANDDKDQRDREGQKDSKVAPPVSGSASSKVDKVQRSTSTPAISSTDSNSNVKKDQQDKEKGGKSNEGSSTNKDNHKDSSSKDSQKDGNKEAAKGEGKSNLKSSKDSSSKDKTESAAPADAPKESKDVKEPKDSGKSSSNTTGAADRAAALAAADPAATSEQKKKKSRPDSSATSSPPPTTAAAASGANKDSAASGLAPTASSKSPRPSTSSGGESKSSKSSSGGNTNSTKGGAAATPPATVSDAKTNPFTQPPPPNEPPPRIFTNRHYQADRGGNGGGASTNTPTPFPAQQQQDQGRGGGGGGGGGYGDRRGSEDWRHDRADGYNHNNDTRQQFQGGGSRGGNLNQPSGNNMNNNNSSNNSSSRKR